jgi:hypothetical protein
MIMIILQSNVNVPNNIPYAHTSLSSISSLSGLQVYTAGWGFLRNNMPTNILQVATVSILTSEACELRVSRLLSSTIESDNRTICTVASPHILLCPVSYHL